jgi:hypothetical protein
MTRFLLVIYAKSLLYCIQTRDKSIATGKPYKFDFYDRFELVVKRFRKAF